MGKESRVGEFHLTNQGYWVEITEWFNSKNCTVSFKNGFTVNHREYNDVKKGKIANPYHPTVLKVGYLGLGLYSPEKNRKAHNKWKDILRRGYCIEFKNKNVAYKNATVSAEWHNFQNFAEWFENNHITDFALDKDILIKGNKQYSPETCCFVPQEINNLFTKREANRGDLPIGVFKNRNKYALSCNRGHMEIKQKSFDTPEECFNYYKFHKEKHIEEVANKWRGKITERCYFAMINYKVEITD